MPVIIELEEGHRIEQIEAKRVARKAVSTILSEIPEELQNILARSADTGWKRHPLRLVMPVSKTGLFRNTIVPAIPLRWEWG